MVDSQERALALLLDAALEEDPPPPKVVPCDMHAPSDVFSVQLECKADMHVDLDRKEWRRLNRLQDEYPDPRTIPPYLYSHSPNLTLLVQDWVAAFEGQYRKPRASFPFEEVVVRKLRMKRGRRPHPLKRTRGPAS